MTAWYVGVDLGASNIKAVVGQESGSVVSRARRRTPPGPDGDAVAEALVAATRAALDDAGVAPEAVVRCGVASIGPLDKAAGELGRSANLGPGIDRVPLTDPLADLLGAEVTVLNDANAGVVGERFYADRTPDDMAYLTISSGIGAGVAVDGRVLSGWDGNAAEVGHNTVEIGGLTCGCGADGHWEAYCSGANIPRHARHVHETEGVPTDLSLDEIDAKDVFEAADDPLAGRVIERMQAYNAAGVADLVHAYAPLVVYVGGAVARNNPEQVVEPVRERLPELVMTNVPEVRLTSLGDEATVRGALAAAITAGANDRSQVRP
ncbi:MULTISPECIES: ROK family protein [Halolamina]|uniref:Glucokinase n=1 Tax=Halolamina pelagica TaxID=699431 RepID=A0A1I5R048_9EURY|nr:MULTISPECIES: ROK family protein [Halolamina]NHX35622.1 ROK family protein [Halolamina sp. R1-12]SFP51872.1 glucokinase [Halolamina pelagica]